MCRADPIALHPVPVAMACAVVLMCLIAWAVPSRAGEDGGDLDLGAYVRGAIGVFNTLSPMKLTPLTGSQTRDLLDGEVVKIRERLQSSSGGDEPHERVLAYHLVEQPMLQVWISAGDPHFLGSSMLTETRVRQDEHGGGVWYQHLDLPWPVADRHWVIRIAKGVEIAAASGGWIWVVSWELEPGGDEIAREVVGAGRAEGLDLDDIEGAVYLPVNHGAWVMFALTERHTLIAYHVTTVLGGNIPDSWINTFAMVQLDGFLKGVGRRSAEVPGHYVEGHEPLWGGDGEVIERFAGERGGDDATGHGDAR